MANREGGLQMDSIWISDSLMIAKIQWIVFGYQKDNKEDRLQMDSIWIFDTCIEGYSGYNGHFWTPRGRWISLILTLNVHHDAMDSFWMSKG